MTTRYPMRLMDVDSIEFNINLTQYNITNIDVFTSENGNDVNIVENIDYEFIHNNKTIFKNISGKKIKYIKITRDSVNTTLNHLEAKYKDNNKNIIANFNNYSNNIIYYIGFPDRSRC